MRAGICRGAAAAAAALALAGCETLGGERVELPPPGPQLTLPPPVIVEVTPPAAAKGACVPRNLRPPPRYPDTDAALREAGGAADRYQLMAQGRLMRQRRLEELERIVAGCR